MDKDMQELLKAAKSAIEPLEAMADFSRTPEDRKAAKIPLDLLKTAISKIERTNNPNPPPSSTT